MSSQFAQPEHRERLVAEGDLSGKGRLTTANKLGVSDWFCCKVGHRAVYVYSGKDDERGTRRIADVHTDGSQDEPRLAFFLSDKTEVYILAKTIPQARQQVG